MRYKILSILLLALFLLPANGWSKQKFTMRGPFNIISHFVQSGSQWKVKLQIESRARKPVKGVLHIQFVNDQNHIIHGGRVLLNAGEPISPKQVVIVNFPAPAHLCQQTTIYRLTFEGW